MPRRVAYSGQVEYLQVLDENGVLDEELARDTLSDGDVRELYEWMILAREYDESAFKLQRSGRMGTFAQNKGHEATALGAARALRKGIDYLVPYYRENAGMFYHGLPMHFALLHWMGDERGNAIPKQYSMSPICVAIGTQTLHATGIAWAFKMRKEDRAVLCFFGEGATSTGDFHEAMNFASVMKVPCVFCCINNQYAISVPCGKQSASETFAQKALGYGMPGVQVDGNDVFAVYKATRDAMQKARAGEGPTLIEALTYRLGDHTTADDAKRYRQPEELEAAMAREPMVRTRKFLESRGLWDAAKEEESKKRAHKTVHDVIDVALNIEKPSPNDMFDYMFEKLPEDLVRQRETLRTDSIGQDPAQIGLKQDPARSR